METNKLSAPTPPVGVIESLSAGFETVAGKIILILLPLLLDLFLWVGPRLTIRPAIANYYHDVWQPSIAELSEEGRAYFGDSITLMSDFLAKGAQEAPDQYLPLFGMPSLLTGQEASTLPFDYSPPVWEVDSTFGLLGVNCLSLGIGFLLGSIYIALIATQVRFGYLRMKRLLVRFPINLFWLGLLAVLLPLLFLIAYTPFLMLGMLFVLFSQQLAVFVWLVGLFLTLWVLMFLVFTIHGLFMNDRNLFASLWDSIRVVQWNMSATIFLVLLVVIINLSLTYIWTLAPTGSWLAVVGVAGHAFVTTGLIAATFVFFKDRYRYWQEVRAEILAELERQRAQGERS